MRQRRRALCKVLLAGVSAGASMLAAPFASAQPAATAPLPLVVQRAPGAADCPDAVTLAARVEKLTGRATLVAATEASGGFTFEVQILKSDDGYTAIVLAAGKSRQISDPGPTCASLEGALALTLAILADADEPPPAAPLEPPREPPLAPPVRFPVFVPPPYVAPPPRYGPRLLISPIVALSEGLSGSLVPALTLVNDLRLIGPLSVLAGFTWMPSRDFTIPGQSVGRVEVQLMYGQIAGCLSTWRFLGAARLGGCLQVNVGGLRGKGVGFAENREVVRPWTSFGPTVLLDVPVVGPLYWSSRASVFAVVPREAFAVDQVGTAFDPSIVGVVVGTGVGIKMF